MDSIIVLITAIVFFLLGKYSHKDVKEIVTTAVKRINKPKAGPINYITEEQKEYIGSEKEKVDAEWKKMMEDKDAVR